MICLFTFKTFYLNNSIKPKNVDSVDHHVAHINIPLFYQRNSYLVQKKKNCTQNLGEHSKSHACVYHNNS